VLKFFGFEIHVNPPDGRQRETRRASKLTFRFGRVIQAGLERAGRTAHSNGKSQCKIISTMKNFNIGHKER